jgi:hypothetical protein
MRVYDIVAENQEIKEAPAGALAQMGRKLGAKALGAIGFKGKSAELTGKAEVGDEANQLKLALRQYAGKAGINVKQMQGPQLAAFLKSKGYPNMHLKGVQGIMTPKQIDQAIMQAAQDAAKADGDPTTGASTASAATKPAATAKDAGGGGAGGGGSATTNVNVQAPAAGGAAAPGQTPTAGTASAAAQGVPPALLKRITQLSAQEKKQLVGML